MNSLGPGSVLWEKGEKIGVGEIKKIGNLREPRGSLGKGKGLPRLLVLPFSTTAEPDPRLIYNIPRENSPQSKAGGRP